MNRKEIITKLNEAKGKANENGDANTHDYAIGYTNAIDYALELLSLLTE